MAIAIAGERIVSEFSPDLPGGSRPYVLNSRSEENFIRNTSIFGPRLEYVFMYSMRIPPYSTYFGQNTDFSEVIWNTYIRIQHVGDPRFQRGRRQKGAQALAAAAAGGAVDEAEEEEAAEEDAETLEDAGEEGVAEEGDEEGATEDVTEEGVTEEQRAAKERAADFADF